MTRTTAKALWMEVKDRIMQRNTEAWRARIRALKRRMEDWDRIKWLERKARR